MVAKGEESQEREPMRLVARGPSDEGVASTTRTYRMADLSSLAATSTTCCPTRRSAWSSRFGIVLNGSPLFTGSAGSGESEIRRYVLENDLVEAIIGLPTDMFYNTGIATYVWILSNKKPDDRKGYVQLIDAGSFWQKMRKSLGSKRKEMSDEHIATVIVALCEQMPVLAVSQLPGVSDVAYASVHDFNHYTESFGISSYPSR